MKVVFTTRSMNQKLLSVCKSRLVGLPHTAVTGSDSLGYLRYILGMDADWVINVDEDAFVVNQVAVLDLLAYMQENNIDFCGMPDGGAMSHRIHNPTGMNAFFNIFHTAKIRPYLTEFRPEDHNADNSHKVEFSFRTPYCYDDWEPYYPVFYWLLKTGFKPLYLLNVLQDADRITTLVGNHKADMMLKHTWYSRDYGICSFQTDRIDRVIASLDTILPHGDIKRVST